MNPKNVAIRDALKVHSLSNEPRIVCTRIKSYTPNDFEK